MPRLSLANADYDSWCGIRENRDFLRWLFFLCMTIFILIALHFIGCLAAECVIQRNLGKGWPSFKRVWEGANFRWRTNNPHYYYVGASSAGEGKATVEIRRERLSTFDDTLALAGFRRTPGKPPKCVEDKVSDEQRHGATVTETSEHDTGTGVYDSALPKADHTLEKISQVSPSCFQIALVTKPAGPS